MKILVYGYGNPGRSDDALGVSLAEQLGEWAKENMPGRLVTDSNYQLNIEDAEMMSAFDLVLFADASKEDLSNYCITKVHPSNDSSFTTHSASAEYLLYLCNSLFGADPPAYMLHIKGYDWDFREGLTEQARENLAQALDHLKERIPLLNGKNNKVLISKEC